MHGKVLNKKEDEETKTETAMRYWQLRRHSGATRVPSHPSKCVPNEYIHCHLDDIDHTTENHTTNHRVSMVN